MYKVSLNVTGIKFSVISIFMDIAKNNDFEVCFDTDHGKLEFHSFSSKKFTKLIDELSNVCKVYGIDYVDML